MHQKAPKALPLQQLERLSTREKEPLERREASFYVFKAHHPAELTWHIKKASSDARAVAFNPL